MNTAKIVAMIFGGLAIAVASSAGTILYIGNKMFGHT